MSKQQALKWRTIIGLILMYLAIWYNWQWMWGLLFLFWVIPDIFRGTTYFIEPIVQKEEPVLFWIIIVSWLLMSVYFIALIFFPEWQHY